ncbi:uncharacterized protein Bfra_001246 [Botrytis fragariae]|uniref:Uncharacterized protein n=1 Tax=Botrytis fragariae TaxID=1964551 RepID=A0A8H6B072_9HELO|nr:uncharacterized protein Bfra_001246 [Botrytis fragariae]KAF5876891.1 hypothetical protein Bfra_001246 [Botrytis fragariae]
MTACIDKREKRGKISHRDAPTVESQHPEESRKKGILSHVVVVAAAYYIHRRSSADTISQIGKISKNIAARSAIAAKLPLNSNGAQAGGDIDTKQEREEEDEDPSKNFDEEADMLEDMIRDKERNQNNWGGGREAGGTWEIPIR